MNKNQLNALRTEYQLSRDLQQERRTQWRTILKEYNLENMDYLLDSALTGTEYATVDNIILDPSVPRLNVNVRKMLIYAAMRDPDFVISSESPRNEAMAQLLEHDFRAIRKDMRWAGKMETAFLNGLLTGLCVVKTGMRSKFVYNETPWSDTLPGDVSNKSYDDEDFPYGELSEYGVYDVNIENPNITPVMSQNITFNLGVRTDEDIRRIYHRTRRPIIDVWRDVRYKKSARAAVKGYASDSGYWDDDIYLTDDIQEDDNATFVDVVECFDTASRQYCVFCPESNVEEPLRDWTLYPFPMIESPYKFFNPIKTLESVWGIPYALLLLNSSQSINLLRRKIIDQIGKEGKIITLIDPVGLDQQDITVINEAKDREFVSYKGLSDPNRSRSPIETISFGGANPELLSLHRIFEADQAWVSGLTDAARNSFSDNEQTATEFAGRQREQGLNIDDIRIRFEQFHEDVAADICKMLLQEWPAEKQVQVVGSNPSVYFWIPVERARLLNQFSLKIVAGSTQKLDKSLLRTQWIQLLPQLIQMNTQMLNERAMGITGGIDWEEAMRQTLEFFDMGIARSVLRRRDILPLLLSLVQDHQMFPSEISPELKAQIKRMIDLKINPLQQAQQQQQQQSMQQGPQQSIQAPDATGEIPQARGGFQPGRMMSEAARI